MKNLIVLLLVLFAIVNKTYSQNANFKINTLTLDVTPNVDSTQKDETKIFKTRNIIEYNNLNKKIRRLTMRRDSIMNLLYKDSIDTLKSQFSAVEIERGLREADSLKALVTTLSIGADTLYSYYTMDYLDLKRFNVLNFGKRRAKAFFDYVYGNTTKRFNSLSSSGFNLGNNSGSVYSELVSGNLGLVRVSMGAMVSKNSGGDSIKAKHEEAYQRLVTYGGNTVLNFEYPLAFIHSSKYQYNLISRIISRGTADLPAFGTTTQKWAGSGSVGLDIYADATLSNNALKFFLNFNVNQIYGTNEYRDNLGIKNKNLTFGQLTLGLVISDNLKISFVVSTFSSESSLTNRDVVLGGQVLK